LRAQHPQRFVTAFVGVIDPVTQRCTYANAGHPAPYVRAHDGTLRQTREHGFPLGLDFSQRLGVDEIVVEPGSLFVLYTDGLTESTHDLIEGEARLETAVRELDAANDGNLAEQVHDAVLGVHARDDVAILVIRAQAAPPLRRWRFDPIWNDVARRVQHELREELRRSGLPPAHYAEVELVFSELLGNAIRYAPGTIEVIAQHRAGAFVLHALDRGPGYLFRPRLPPDLYSEFGRGLFLISRLSDAFTVERRAGGGSHARVEFATYGRPST
jgi:anti-sigma regulatory factor (Ser/Thr protein kinase)